jgi:hypothetical protein
LADVEIIARIECRRKWTAQEKAALLAEVEAEGGKVTVVARRHRISEIGGCEFWFLVMLLFT